MEPINGSGHRIQKHIAKGKLPEIALEKALAEWESVQHLTDVRLVEPNTAKLIAELQKKNYTIMGLTTRGLSLATRTAQQLENLSIDLSRKCFTQEEVSFLNGRTLLLRKGILFTAGTHKGNALLKLLDLVKVKPKKIVFINDKASGSPKHVMLGL